MRCSLIFFVLVGLAACSDLAVDLEDSKALVVDVPVKEAVKKEAKEVDAETSEAEEVDTKALESNKSETLTDAPDTPAEVSQLDANSENINGTKAIKLNAIQLNGTNVNGTKVDGTPLDAPLATANGTKVNETNVNGTKVNGTKADGTPLDAPLATVNGTKVNGTKVIGTMVIGTKVNGTKVDGTNVNETKVDGTPLDAPLATANGTNVNKTKVDGTPLDAPLATANGTKQSLNTTQALNATSDAGTSTKKPANENAASLVSTRLLSRKPLPSESLKRVKRGPSYVSTDAISHMFGSHSSESKEDDTAQLIALLNSLVQQSKCCNDGNQGYNGYCNYGYPYYGSYCGCQYPYYRSGTGLESAPKSAIPQGDPQASGTKSNVPDLQNIWPGPQNTAEQSQNFNPLIQGRSLFPPNIFGSPIQKQLQYPSVDPREAELRDLSSQGVPQWHPASIQRSFAQQQLHWLSQFGPVTEGPATSTSPSTGTEATTKSADE